MQGSRTVCLVNGELEFGVADYCSSLEVDLGAGHGRQIGDRVRHQQVPCHKPLYMTHYTSYGMPVLTDNSMFELFQILLATRPRRSPVIKQVD